MRRTLAAAIAATLGATASSAGAVVLSPRGTGQVLIYPYYTVNHQQTLVSVINTTEHGKALKIRFREAYNGRDVANFNVYLGPYDSWVGSVFDTSSDGTGAGAIATNDNSCTVPAFPLAPVPGTLHALTFSNANYSQGGYGMPTGTDHAPTGLARTREGFIEIIEMGEVVDQAGGSQKTLEAITPVNGIPPGCAQVRNAWAAGGYWTTNVTTDLLPPAGGVYGAAGIVDVAQGTLYAFDAMAIDGFSDVVQHSAPGDPKPNLSTAITDSAHDLATAYVPIGNTMIKADYIASTAGIDAVSAVLMADTIYNEFDVEPGVGAATDWVATFPTKQFYVDPAIVDTSVQPFENLFDQTSCHGIGIATYDREGGQPPGYVCYGPGGCPGSYLCFESEILTFNAMPTESGPSKALGSNVFPFSVPDAVRLPSRYELPAAGNWALSFPNADELTAAVCRRRRIHRHAGNRFRRYQLHQRQRHAWRAVELQRRVPAPQSRELREVHKSTKRMPLIEQTMKRTLAIAIAAASGMTASTGEAVMLNPRGTGQVLIYPYYTVNHQQTLVSVVNTTEHGKALKIRFREAYDGRDVANFNVYLGPYDSWVGAVFDTSSNGTGAAAIATNDNSCTDPLFPLIAESGTLHALAFSNANYTQGGYGTQTGTDNGPYGLDRTREGFFEIIEMGEVVDQAVGGHNTFEAITPVGGNPPGCAQVRNAWKNDGYWNAHPATDLLPPAGGLYGAASIVDVALGTLYAYDATAIDGFSDVVQNTRVGDTKPNFSTAITDSAHDTATAYVPIGNTVVKADYTASTAGVDAVSAVLMADAISNEFDIESALGAATDWLVTFPTKQFYVDPAFVGVNALDVVRPFNIVFDEFSCHGVDPELVDRDGHAAGSVVEAPPVNAGNYICYETSVIPLNGDYIESKALGSRISDFRYLSYTGVPSQAGHGALRFVDTEQQLRPATSGAVFNGLPAIGFAAINYIDANVTPGVLSNYSAAYPHRGHASCSNSTNPQNACP